MTQTQQPRTSQCPGRFIGCIQFGGVFATELRSIDGKHKWKPLLDPRFEKCAYCGEMRRRPESVPA